MKKFLAMIVAICMVATVLCVPAFAAEARAAGAALRVSAQKGSSLVVIQDYANLKEGWNYAMELAGDEDEMQDRGYSRVVVDIYRDWIADDDNFGSGDGFGYGAIYIPDEAKVTLNLNGHTVDRGITVSNYYFNGEVICIGDGADVIINDGTIKGGNSSYSAGGMYIKDDARVTLNNVNFDGNFTSWTGGAIAVNDGSILTVNGGSFTNNTGDGTPYIGSYGGAVYVEDATATLNGVAFKGNGVTGSADQGGAIYATDSQVVISNCTFEDNGIAKTTYDYCNSVVYAVDSSLNVTASVFKGNGQREDESFPNSSFTAIFMLDESELLMDSCEIRDSKSCYVIVDTDESMVRASYTKFVNNDAGVMAGDTATSADSSFYACTFENNAVPNGFASFHQITTPMLFHNCSMGNSTFSYAKQIKIVNDETGESALASLSALKKDGTTVKIQDYGSIEACWNDAMELALNDFAMTVYGYDRIVVDLYSDWIASEGQFTTDFNNGAGFNWDAIYVPSNTRVMLNMNGHTINRGLTDNEANGEVIYVDEGADLIINGGKNGDAIARGDDTTAKFGTISGGYSHNGAGGIHICEDATVTLNNVRVDGNQTEDDDGSAMAVYDGATLIMNGGSISNNRLDSSKVISYVESFGGLYMNNASAVLTSVLINDNGEYRITSAAGIFMEDSRLEMKNCYVLKNGYRSEEKSYSPSSVIIYATGDSSVLDIKDSTFENNGSEGFRGGCVIAVEDGTLKIDHSDFLNNATTEILYCSEAVVEVTNSRFQGNAGSVFTGEVAEGSHFTKCTFTENTKQEGYSTFKFYDGEKIAFNDCEFGNATFNDRTLATFDGKAGVGSLFGEGSLTMIVAIVAVFALVSSGVSIFLIVDMKKKAVPAAAGSTAEGEDKE